ncbi:MAG: hypothetical protein AAFP00_18480 [Bacteroidota bacterium]
MTLILFLLVALGFGAYDAGLFAHTEKNYPEGYNPHLYMLPLRGLVLFPILGLYIVWNGFEPVTLGLNVFIFLCLFSWPHNGLYYSIRGRLDVPSYNWFSTSSSSTARFTLTHPERLYLFLLGLIIYYTLNISTMAIFWPIFLFLLQLTTWLLVMRTTWYKLISQYILWQLLYLLLSCGTCYALVFLAEATYGIPAYEQSFNPYTITTILYFIFSMGLFFPLAQRLRTQR